MIIRFGLNYETYNLPGLGIIFARHNEEYGSVAYAIVRTLAKSSVLMSHCLLWRHIVLLMTCDYSSNHGVLYIIVISVTRRIKKCRAVRLSFSF